MTQTVTPHVVPISWTFKEDTLVFYVREVLQESAKEFGVPLTEKEVAALDYFDNCARANAFQFRLEQGDALFMNNRTTLHARTEFKNGSDDARKRHLMRLWLDVPGMRPDVPEIQLYENDDGRSGIDPQKGKVRAAAHYRMMPNGSA